ncbi:hypothetical protein SGLAM104S_03889 [Streptomyces glaucescens]
MSWVADAPVTTARSSRVARPVASDQPMSSGAGSRSPSTWVSRRAAWARRASAPRAESTQGTVGSAVGPAVPAGSGSVSSSCGACSRMTCALVPLTPKEDTPARRGRSSADGHSRACVSSSTAPADQSTLVDGSVTCSVRGSTPCCIARTILITPAAPAAACVCPMFDFSEPSSSGRPWGRTCP